ncbi:MAG: carbohydrate ABC transporter permease [Lachnospiraceae bacterium]|uniref:carbohydrate ABC transporter permease n=1 Tax=uncultured Acetatifactor sp. TaxID=1671927 RepID=UPI002617831F|nr:carbohydrate ABC transporter permease [uncultured Acetatifactor sp.]MCI8789978.1 carbohydrate ABC transporter permease [Lachnospiraceae bacterium]
MKDKTYRKKELNQLSMKWNIVFSMILCVVALAMVLPLALVVIISFSSESSIAHIGYSFFPEELSLEGYRYLIKMGDQLFRSYGITIFYTVAGTALSMAVMSMFAYVISVRGFWLNRPLTWFLFFTMLFSGGLVPSYIVNVKYLHLGDSIWIFLLPGLVSAYNVIILRTFIRTTIPEALFDAARIDGAGHFTIFFRIVMPLFKAGLATVALFNVVGRWNDWFTGMLYVENPNLIPLQTLLTKLQNSVEYLKKNSAVLNTPDGLQLARSAPSISLRMACTVAVILPMLFAYPFFQRFFVNGLTVGSIKE